MNRALVLLLGLLGVVAVGFLLAEILREDTTSPADPGVTHVDRDGVREEGSPLRQEAPRRSPAEVLGRPAVALWDPDESWDGVELESDAYGREIPVPDPRTPRWGERLLDQLGTVVFVRMRDRETWEIAKSAVPGPLAEQEVVPFPEIENLYRETGLEVMPEPSVLYMRRRPAEGEDPEPWPPPR